MELPSGSGQDKGTNVASRFKRNYLICRVNNAPVIALLAPGCGATYMTRRALERLQLSHQVNSRITGIFDVDAPEMGKQTVVGQLPPTPVYLAKETLIHSSFLITDDCHNDAVYFGCDSLLKFVNFDETIKDGTIRVERHGTVIDIPVLSYEEECPSGDEACRISALPINPAHLGMWE